VAGGNRRPPWQAAQLEADLARGEVIPYRRLPGTGPRDFGPRTYYNPATGDQVSEDYVIRRYRPAIRNNSSAQYLEYRERERLVTRTQARQRASFQQTFLIKKAADSGNTSYVTLNPDGTVTTSFPQSFIRENQQEFNGLYATLRYHAIQSRFVDTGIRYNERTGVPTFPAPGTSELDEYLHSEGDYANTLVDLGRRLPGETAPVNSSPDSRGGNILNDYIATFVIPHYANQ
jgi:hypothetical protein